MEHAWMDLLPRDIFVNVNLVIQGKTAKKVKETKCTVTSIFYCVLLIVHDIQQKAIISNSLFTEISAVSSKASSSRY